MEPTPHNAPSYMTRCPNCLSVETALLPFISSQAWVWYYRCVRCGFVWTREKSNEDV